MFIIIKEAARCPHRKHYPIAICMQVCTAVDHYSHRSSLYCTSALKAYHYIVHNCRQPPAFTFIYYHDLSNEMQGKAVNYKRKWNCVTQIYFPFIIFTDPMSSQIIWCINYEEDDEWYMIHLKLRYVGWLMIGLCKILFTQMSYDAEYCSSCEMTLNYAIFLWSD